MNRGSKITKKMTASLLVLFLVMSIHASHLKAANLVLSQGYSSSEATLYIAPPRSFAEVNNEFSMNVSIANVTDLYGWEFKIRWNSTLLEAINITEGDFLKDYSETFFVIDINNTAGYLIAACTLLGGIPGVNGSGTLATIRYFVETSGECILDLYDTKLVNSTEQSIEHVTNDGYFGSNLHDISIIQVDVSPTTAYIGELIEINVSVLNEGTDQEIFNVTAYANSTFVGSETCSLESNESILVTFLWDTQGYAKGDYLISAVATIVPGEEDVTDNTKAASESVKLLSPDHDVSINNVLLDRNVVSQGLILHVTVIAKNYGGFDETFNITTYVNETAINTIRISLVSGNSTEFTVVWNTTGFAKGNYTIWAYAWPVPNETQTNDNTFVGGVVWVRWPYDNTGDGYCGIDDIVAVAEHFGTDPSSLNWDPIYDVNCDNYVGIDDVVETAEHFGEEET